MADANQDVSQDRPVRCAVVGYGPEHSFGRQHGRWIDASPGLTWAAVCDTNPARLEAATAEFPHLETYTDLDQLLAADTVDLVSIVTPHHTHAPLALAALAAGKHVVVDKAMCLTVAEATAMIDAAQAAGVMLAVFHVRRHDGNYRALQQAVRDGLIGEVFHLELSAGGYGRPRDWWYSRKALSGGAFYYWGPHALDWVLNLVPSRVRSVTGLYHKKLWPEVDIEDQTRAILRFENGATADVTWSHLDASTLLAPKPLWRLLGTKGAIVDTGAGSGAGLLTEIEAPPSGSFQMSEVLGETRQVTEVPYQSSDWWTYYRDVADHLLRGRPVPVSGQEGRRTIALFEAAERSSRSGQAEPVAYESEDAEAKP